MGFGEAKLPTVRTTAVILLAGHTLQSNVMRGRDCGANFVIAKPITPKILYDRVVWLAKDARAFVESPSYVGPDRRFQKIGRLLARRVAGATTFRCWLGRQNAQSLAIRDRCNAQWKRGRTAMTKQLPAHTKRLAQLINQPGGITAQEAVAAAEQQLEGLRERGLSDITATIRAVQALASGLPPEELEARGNELYRMSNSLIGVAGVFGKSGVGDVALSFCTLIERRRSPGIGIAMPSKPIWIACGSCRRMA